MLKNNREDIAGRLKNPDKSNFRLCNIKFIELENNRIGEFKNFYIYESD